MKLIFTSKQSPEIAHLPALERRAIIRRHHWKVYSGWQGWLGLGVYVAGMVICIMAPSSVLPDTISNPTRIALRLLIFSFAAIIYLITYYDALRPHIRKEMEFWISKGILEQQKTKLSEQAG